MLVSISQSAMKSHSETSKLYDMPAFQHFFGPARSIVAWAMTKREVYHLQFCDYEYGDGSAYGLSDPPSSPYITTLTDASGLKHRWSDFAPSIQHILGSTESFTKWKIAELPALPTYCSHTSRIVLIGDAAHAVQPFAGQGANMAIEDAAALSTLLSQIASKSNIPDVMKVYDAVRLPRLAGLRDIIEANVRLFGMKDAEQHGKQNEVKSAAEKERRESEGKKTEEARPKNESIRERMKWLEVYDAVGEVSLPWSSRRR